jgi:hypothetical protein
MGFSLSALTKENAVRGMCTVIHGSGGVGKTTIAAQVAEKHDGVIVLGEDGLSPLGFEDIPRTPVVESWADFQDMLETFALEDHSYRTVVIDTMDAMMPILQDHVVNKYYDGSISKANAFKAMYTEMAMEFNKVLTVLKMIQNKSINIIILVHSVVDTYRAPDSEPFQKFSLNLPGGAKTSLASMLYDYADNVLFARRDVLVSEKKGKSAGRVLMTEWEPAYDAKTRTEAPAKLPLSYDAYFKYFI